MGCPPARSRWMSYAPGGCCAGRCLPGFAWSNATPSRAAVRWRCGPRLSRPAPPAIPTSSWPTRSPMACSPRWRRSWSARPALAGCRWASWPIGGASATRRPRSAASAPRRGWCAGYEPGCPQTGGDPEVSSEGTAPATRPDTGLGCAADTAHRAGLRVPARPRLLLASPEWSCPVPTLVVRRPRPRLPGCRVAPIVRLLLAAPAANAAAPTTQPVAPAPSSTLRPPATPTTTITTLAPSAPPTTTPSGSGGARDRLRDRLPFPFGNGPGFPDIAGRIRDAINGWFRDLVASSLGPLLDMVARTILATPDLTAATSRVRELWWVSAGIANTAFVLLVTAGGVLVMTHETLQTSYGVKEIAPRLVVAFLVANLSLALTRQAIPLANALARALLGTGTDPAHVQATLRTLALAPLDTSSGLLILIALVIAVMALALVATYVIRVALLIVLIAGAPLALACHALP